MRRRKLFLQLFPLYSLITLASLLVISLYFVNTLHNVYYEQVADNLELCAQLVGSQFERNGIPQSEKELGKLVRSLSKKCRARLTVVSVSGVVLADSEKKPAQMENHADRPEIKNALAVGIGMSRRRSPTMGMVMVYVAIPVVEKGKAVGVVRASRAVNTTDAVLSITYRLIVLAVAVTGIFAGIAGFVVTRRIGISLSRLRDAAARMAAGDLNSRVPVPDTLEFADLAETLNGMAEQLSRTIRTSSNISREQQAILSSMQEGVIAVTNDDRVLILNPAAEQLLGVSMDEARGKVVSEVIRHSGLLKLLERCRGDQVALAEEIVIRDVSTGIAQDKILQATGKALVDTEGKKIGALVVLNDVTQTRKLENMRREFVANVSHELKTPITSIKGFIETILDGALDDPVKAREFLEIVARQTDRLDSIIEDLLTLSAIEQKSESAEILKEPTKVRGLLEQAAATLQVKAKAADIRIDIECSDDLIALVNAPLMEQAIINLLDNAIKYSPPGGTVKLIAESTNDYAGIHVVDNGPGIAAEHIPRLFERFYRVDKARSRKMGGTGLGLAIVKHIVQAHRGRTEVQSALGKGSTFSIFVPVQE
jgi:two-component system phosphate regulon sensor histidine kinase PhoR